MQDAFWWNEELTQFRDMVHAFVGDRIAPGRATWRAEGRIPADVWRALGAMGLLCPAADEAHGGAGGNIAHEAIVIDALERLAPELTPGVTVHGLIASNYVRVYGSEEQKRRFLPRLASGESVAAIAMTEPHTGSDLRAIRTRARPTEDGYVIDGQKIFITNGDSAELIIVAVKTGEAGSTAISLLVVDRRESSGVTTRVLDKIGMHAGDTSELFFDNVIVPRDNLLGDVEGIGLRQLMAQLPYERLGIAIAAAAAMDRACQITVDYAKERKAFDTPILDFQHNGFLLAERTTEALLARLFVDHCIGRALDTTLDGATAARAKWWTTEHSFQTVDDCLQLHGGYGYMTEYEISRMMTDARALRIYGGTSEMMKLIISRSL